MNPMNESDAMMNMEDDDDDIINDINPVLMALTQWTRTVLQSLPPILTTMQKEEMKGRDHDNEEEEEEEWEYESSFPEFQMELSQTNDAIRSLLQPILRLFHDTTTGSNSSDDVVVVVEDPLLLYEQCRDDYEVWIQQMEIYLSSLTTTTTTSNGNGNNSILPPLPSSFPTTTATTTTTANTSSLESPLVLQKPQDIYPMIHHYCHQHLRNTFETPVTNTAIITTTITTPTRYDRTIPFTPHIVVLPLPFHHASNTTNTTTTTILLQRKYGSNGYQNRHGKLGIRSSREEDALTTTTTTTSTTHTATTITKDYYDNYYYEHLYRTEIEQLMYTSEQIQIATSYEALPSIPLPIFTMDVTTTTNNNKNIHSNNTPLPSYTYIDTEVQLQSLIRIIEDTHITTIALDIEAHSYRSFVGMICLIQLSFYTNNDSNSNNTSIQNYIIDALVLHDCIPKYLLPIMVNPNIVKVFHGADMDIQWLQRDFSIYVVNLFDTYRAAKYINEYPYHNNNNNSSNKKKKDADTVQTTKGDVVVVSQSHRHQMPKMTRTKKFAALGYAGIVQHYTSNTINKHHQLSDWRIRPLPPDMIQYAVQDTYYLIAIYEYMKYDLYHECGGSTQAIIDVLDICKDVSLVRYCPPPFDPYGYRSLLLSSTSSSKPSRGHATASSQHRYRYKKAMHHTITVPQEMILKALWDWRDKIARHEDESIMYVCSNAQLLRIVYSINYGNISTITESQLLSIFQNTSSSSTSTSRPTPPLLIKYVADICELIQLAINGTNADDVDEVSQCTTIAGRSVTGAAKNDDNNENNVERVDEMDDDEDLDEDDDEQEEEDEDLDDDDDEEDEEVVNSGRVNSVPNEETTRVTAVVGPSGTTGSAFFKPATKSGNPGSSIDSSKRTTTNVTTMLDTSGMHPISTSVSSLPECGNMMARTSPVLGTEALYEQAGWMTPNDSIPQKEQLFVKNMDRQRMIAAIDKPTVTAGFGMNNDEKVVVVYHSTKPMKFLSVHGSNQEFRSDVLDNDRLPLSGNPKGIHKTARVVTVLPDSQNFNSIGDNASGINQGDTVHDSWKEAIPAVLGLLSTAENNDRRNDVDDDDDDDLVDDENDNGTGNNQQGRTVNSSTRTSERTKTDVEEEFLIPRSIREIYMISNRNRRNKKTGSPTPERGVTPTNEKERLALAEAEALLLSRGDIAAKYFMDDTATGKRQRQRAKSNTGRESEETLPLYDSSMDVASKEDDFNFMKSIGWIPNNKDVSVDTFLNQRPVAPIVLSPTEPTYSSAHASTNAINDNDSSLKHVAIDPTVAQIGVIHPTSQHVWNSGSSPNPFFAGAAAQGGGPLQQQRNLGGTKSSSLSSSGTATNKGVKATMNNATTANSRSTGPSGTSSSNNNTNRQLERPDKKESRSYAYRRR